MTSQNAIGILIFDLLYFIIKRQLGMNKFILFFIILCSVQITYAHGADISTLVFRENEDQTWSLQVRSSLDAFRKEVKSYFYDCPYTTPEEFNNQLLEHFENTLKLSIDDELDVPLMNGSVKLGHEAVVFYNNIKLPENFNSIKIKGTMFKEIYRSRVKVLIIKKGFNNTPFILSRKNSFSIDLVVEEDHFKLWSKEEES